MIDISIFILILLLLFSLYYYYTTYVEGLKSKIGKAFKRLGKFGKDIKSFGKKLGEEIKKVGRLGKELKTFGKKIEKGFKEIPKAFKKMDKAIKGIAKKAGRKIKGSFDKVERFFKKIIDKIWSELKRIIKFIEKLPALVAKWAKKIFVDIIPKFLKKVWSMFYNKVIKPIVNFFDDLGTIFGSVGKIFDIIIKKLKQMPGCIPIYGVEASKYGTRYVYSNFVPGWLKGICNFFIFLLNLIFTPIIYIFSYFFKFIFEVVGFDFNFYDYESHKQKCFDWGPLMRMFNAFMRIFNTIFKFIRDIFKFLNIVALIQELLRFLGLTKKKKKKQQATSVMNKLGNVISDAQDAVTETGQRIVENTLSSTKKGLSQVGIRVPDVNIQNTLNSLSTDVRLTGLENGLNPPELQPLV